MKRNLSLGETQGELVRLKGYLQYIDETIAEMADSIMSKEAFDTYIDALYKTKEIINEDIEYLEARFKKKC